VLEVRRLKLTLNGKPVINDLNLEVKAGKIHGLLGMNLPPASWGGICGANSHTFVTRIRFAAPKDAACHPTPRFIPAASCGAFSLNFGKWDRKDNAG